MFEAIYSKKSKKDDVLFRPLSYTAFSKFFTGGSDSFIKYMKYDDKFSWTKSMIPGDIVHRKLLLQNAIDDHPVKEIKELIDSNKSVVTQDFVIDCYNSLYSGLPLTYTVKQKTLKASKFLEQLNKLDPNNKFKIKSIYYMGYKAFKTHIDRMIKYYENNDVAKQHIMEGNNDYSGENLYEFKVDAILNNYPTTVKFDKIYVNHNDNKVIIKDLKTTSSIENVRESVDKFNYDIQGNLSIEMAREYLKEQGLDSKNYDITFDFVFINKGTPKENNIVILPFDNIMEMNAELKMNTVYTYLSKKGIKIESLKK